MDEQKKEIQWLLNEKYGGELTEAAQKDINRVMKGEHIDYVIGFTRFLGCTIDLTQRPLIPRPETEYWTEKAIESMRAKVQDPYYRIPTLRILDIFAGSGCIGISVLHHVQRSVVDFAEKETQFCSQIRTNAELNRIVQSRYRVIQSDLFENLAKEPYDVILANPPYIAEERKDQVQESVLLQEPKEALFAGEDGLGVIRPFLKEALSYLKPKGTVYMEFDSPQKDAIEHLLNEYGYSSWQFCKDQFDQWRYVVVRR